MNKATVIFLFFILIFVSCRSQLMPADGATLNYRIIGFSFPGEIDGSYTVEIAKGSFTSPKDFKMNIIKTAEAKGNKTVIEVPAFSQEYTWRYAAGGKESALNHFKTGAISDIDTSNLRLRIIKTAETHEDAYVFTDGNKIMYDMQGRPVWYLPDVDGKVAGSAEIRDIKLTPKGTISFINDNRAYEIDYAGNVLWRSPLNGKVGGDREEYLHHEMNMLSNGHYMILGNQFVTPPKGKMDEDDGLPSSVFKPAKMIHYGTVIEYDHDGNVVWSWKSSKFLAAKELYYPDLANVQSEKAPHENAFFFDERSKMLYVSFRNISQIIKIKYPEGNIVATYGNVLKPGDEKNPMFCQQHSCKVTKNGALTVFNNDICRWPQSKPKLQMFREPQSGNELKKIWEYETGPEVSTEIAPGGINKTSGGNLIELPDQSFFASMCSPYVNIFIVDRDKKILWNAVPEKRSTKGKGWEPAGQYRASIIPDRQHMEQLVWSVRK